MMSILLAAMPQTREVILGPDIVGEVASRPSFNLAGSDCGYR